MAGPATHPSLRGLDIGRLPDCDASLIHHIPATTGRCRDCGRTADQLWRDPDEHTIVPVTPRPTNGEVRAKDPVTGAEKGRKPERFSLIPPSALAEVARVYGYGADKYEDWNWLRGMPWSWLADASQRHFNQWLDGEDRDSESGLHHLAHAAFHLLGLLEFSHRQLGTDDRPPRA